MPEHNTLLEHSSQEMNVFSKKFIKDSEKDASTGRVHYVLQILHKRLPTNKNRLGRAVVWHMVASDT